MKTGGRIAGIVLAAVLFWILYSGTECTLVSGHSFWAASVGNVSGLDIAVRCALFGAVAGLTALTVCVHRMRRARRTGASPTESGRVENEVPLSAFGAILVVDDEAVVRRVTQSILQRYGFRVFTAADGRGCVEIFRTYADEIAAVLLDLNMPRMDGEEVFHQLRRLKPGVRIILTSGYSRQDAAGRFAGQEIAGFIQKPYASEDLLACLRRALQPPAPSRVNCALGWAS